MVDTLTQAIVNSSDSSDADAMAKLGGYVAQFQSEAVKDNLDEAGGVSRPAIRLAVQQLRPRPSETPGNDAWFANADRGFML